MPSLKSGPSHTPCEPRILPVEKTGQLTVPSAKGKPSVKVQDLIAFAAAVDAVQTTPTCFRNLKTLNLSKSESPRLFSLCSRRFAHALSDHFSSTPSFSHAFATGPLPAARGNLGMTRGVTMRFDREIAWRGTEAFSFVEGPSTRAYEIA